MKKRKIFFSTLASMCMFALALTSASCGNEPKEEQYKIYELAKASGFTGTYEEWIASIKGADGKDGKEIELSIEDNKIVWRYVGETTWKDIYSINDIIGPKGDKGESGKDGLSISKIVKSDSKDLVDTYTIIYSDGSTSTFVVTNGKNGEQGIQGLPGKDGHTPNISINEEGFWMVDEVATTIKASGIKGNQGESGKTAYELYREVHPEYKGTQKEWLDDLANGRLGDNSVEKIYHTVKFITGTNEKIEDQKVKHFYKVTKPTDPVKDGYTFDGWYNGEDKWIFCGYSVTEDVTLTAHWTISSFKITIDQDNGSKVEDKSLSYGEELNLEIPVKKDCIFDHWEDETGKTVTFPLLVTSNMSLTAKYHYVGNLVTPIEVTTAKVIISKLANASEDYITNQLMYTRGTVKQVTRNESTYTLTLTDGTNEIVVLDAINKNAYSPDVGDEVIVSGFGKKTNAGYFITKNLNNTVDPKIETLVKNNYAVLNYTGTTSTNFTGIGNEAAKVNLNPDMFTLTAYSGTKINQFEPGNPPLFPGLNKSGEIRLYQDGGDHGFEIKIASGYTIANIELVYSINRGSASILVNNEEVVPNPETGIYLINNSSFKVINKISSQIKIKEIRIKYIVNK